MRVVPSNAKSLPTGACVVSPLYPLHVGSQRWNEILAVGWRTSYRRPCGTRGEGFLGKSGAIPMNREFSFQNAPRCPSHGRAAIAFRDCRRRSEANGAPLRSRMEPMLIGSVRLALRRSAARTVEAAHGPALHRGSLAPLVRSLRGCRARHDRIPELAAWKKACDQRSALC
jgi:hypothetical protein